MMEDDPDYGYYCETGDDDFTPLSYHVVFFDKEVSRTWVNAVCIRNFSTDDDPEDMGKVACRGKNYRRQLTAATLEARKAAQMPLESRLAKYGFAARYKGPIGMKGKEHSPTSFHEQEFSADSESSSLEICSSGNSYSTENSSPGKEKTTTSPRSSPDEKSSKKPFKGKTKKKDNSEGIAKKQRKNEGKKRQNKSKQAVLEIKNNKSKEVLPHHQYTCDGDLPHVRDVTEPFHKHLMKENLQNNTKNTSLRPEELENSDPSALNTTLDAEQTTSCNQRNVNDPNEGKPIENSSTGTKAVKKRRSSGKAVQCDKKRTISEDTQDNSKVNMNFIERDKRLELVENDVASDRLSLKTQKKQRVSGESQISIDEDAKVDTNPRNLVQQNEEDTCMLSASNKSKANASKGKQFRKRPNDFNESAYKSTLEDKKETEETKVTQFQSTDNNKTKGKSKQLDSQKNQVKKVIKEKSTSLKEGREIQECKTENNEVKTSRSEISGGTRASKMGDHPEHCKPSFVLKRSLASTDLRVSVGVDTSFKRKPLPKLKKVFKPPVAKAAKTDKDLAMPKLLKPHFVSPALAKPHDKSDCSEAGSQETIHTNAFTKGTTLPSMKQTTLKRKASNCNLRHDSEMQKKSKEDVEHNDILSEDLQAEIDEVDSDIANMQKELTISDTSDTSISEEMISPAADQHSCPDSPEF